MFNWKKFVDEVEVMLDSTGKKVDYLCYHRIDIHPYGNGTNLVGAYKFDNESKDDKNLIVFFEENGVKICAIIKAMNYVLNDSWYEGQEFFNTAAQYFEDGIIVLQKAFKKFEKLEENPGENLGENLED